MEALVAQTEREVINFGESWKQATGRRKREIQTALFPEGLVYDQKQLFLNRFNRLLVIDTEGLIDPQHIIDDDDCLIGVPGGIRTRVTAVKGRCPRPG